MLIFNKQFYYENNIEFYRYSLILKIKQRSYPSIEQRFRPWRISDVLYICIGNLDRKISFYVFIYYYFFSREINFELSLSLEQ